VNGSCERRGGDDSDDPRIAPCCPAIDEYGLFDANPAAREVGSSSSGCVLHAEG